MSVTEPLDQLAVVKQPKSADTPRITITGSEAEAVSPIIADGDVALGYKEPDDLSDDDERWLITGWGLNPDRWEIIPGSLSVNRWQGMTHKGNNNALVWQHQYKARLHRRAGVVASPAEVADIIRDLRRKPAVTPPMVDGAPQWLVVVLSDTQAGKGEGGGTPALARRLRHQADRIRKKIKEAKKAGRPFTGVLILGGGDLVEQCSGHYAMQTFSVDLDNRSQERFVREVIRMMVDAVVDLVPEIRLMAVPGNHGECFATGTDLLTAQGWIPVERMDGTETLGTINPNTHEFEWQDATAWTSYNYAGPMVRVHGRNTELLVTPNHDLYATVKRGGGWTAHLDPSKWHKEPAGDQTKGIHFALHAAAEWIGKTEPVVINTYRDAVGRRKPAAPLAFTADLTLLAEFLGWYVSERSCSLDGEDWRICISQSQRVNPLRYDRIRQLLLDLGLNPTDHCSGKGWRFSNASIAYWLVKEFGGNSHDKRLPAWMKNWPEELLREFLASYQEGDGHKYSETGFDFKTASHQLAGDLQELAVKLGQRCTFGKLTAHPVKGTAYVGHAYPVYLNQRRCSEVKSEVVDYQGRVYCPTVPNGLVVARRDGKVCISGNSRSDGKAYTTWTDNSDLAVFEQVFEALRENPARYGHVTLDLPGEADIPGQVSDPLVIVREIGDVKLGAHHGHAIRKGGHAIAKVESWWATQALGQRPIAAADILVVGHLHHFLCSETTGRTIFQAPANDGGSYWWTVASGQSSPPGLLTFGIGQIYGPRKWGDLEIIGAPEEAA